MRRLWKRFFLFSEDCDPAWSPRRRAAYHAYRVLALLCAGLAMGAVLLLLALGPYASAYFYRFALPEYFTQPKLVLLNAVPVALLALLFYAITGRAWSGFLLGCALPVGLGLGNYYKLCFRDDPLYFEDMLLLQEAHDMVGQGRYQLFVDRYILAAAAAYVVIAALLYALAPGKIRSVRRRAVQAAVAAGVSALLLPCYFDAGTYQSVGSYEYLSFASYTHRYMAHGFVYPFIHSVTDFTETAPEGYTAAKARELLSAYQDADIPEDRRISVIAIMREAYVDFSRYQIEGLDGSGYQLYHQLEAEGRGGSLLTNAAYGATIDTERGFITGNYVFRNFRGNSNAYPWYFRNQGYTVEGCHPYNQWFYNRRNVNGYLGFQRYRFLEGDFETLTDARYPEDSVLFAEIWKDYTANKATGRPYFSFNVTVATHGPYPTDVREAEELAENGSGGGRPSAVYEAGAPGLSGAYSEECKNAVSNYLYRIRLSDEALAGLVENLRKDPDPVVLVTFGDHLPWMGNGNEYYHEMGINLDTSTDDGFRTYYSTRYLIWANPAAEKVLGHSVTGTGPEVSPCFLMNEIFRQLDWEGPAFMQAMDDVMDVMPVVSTHERYLIDGELTDAIPEEKRALYQNFLYLQQYWRRNFYMGG